MRIKEGAYYQPREVESFGEHMYAYKRAIHRLSNASPDLLSSSQSKTFVLGGIYPHNSTKFDFLKLAEDIHPRDQGVADRHIILDINFEPLALAREHLAMIGKHPEFLQADLTNLPFVNAVDFLFVDHTLSFMSDLQLNKFGESVSRSLTKNGVALVVNSEPGLSRRVSQLLRSRANRTKISTRRTSDIISRVVDTLKPVIVAGCDYPGVQKGDFTLAAFSRHDSVYDPHKGAPLAYYQSEE
jgi:hypothetical protein